jgi:hypothetical protein
MVARSVRTTATKGTTRLAMAFSIALQKKMEGQVLHRKFWECQTSGVEQATDEEKSEDTISPHRLHHHLSVYSAGSRG